MKRVIFASRETAINAKASKAKMVKVYSFFPIDRANCDCKQLIQEWNKRLGIENDEGRRKLLEKTPFLECPRSKNKRMERYKIECQSCGDLQGYAYASNPSLDDWCDFHYVQWSKGDVWHGCFTPHISPITQKLLLECCCGNDTRDFRANMTINEKVARRIEDRNAKGREFDQPDSKFVASKITGKVVT